MKPGEFHVWTVWHPQPANTPAANTFQVHYKILKKYDEVFWGVITKKRAYPDNHPFADGVEKISAQLDDGVATFLFIKPRDDEDKPIRGEIKAVKIDIPEWWNIKTVPSYYREIVSNHGDYKISYWFLLSNIELIDPQIMLQLKKLEHFDSPKHGSSGYPYPCICKIINSGEETARTVLFWEDIIIIFVSTEVVSIEIKGVPLNKRHYSFEELNFNDNRRMHSNKRVRAWDVLLFTAANQGSISFNTAEKHWGAKPDNCKKMINEAGKRLRSGLLLILPNNYDIVGPAFKYQREEAYYKSLFTIKLGPTFYKKAYIDDDQDSCDDIRQVIKDEQKRTGIPQKSHYMTSDIDEDQ